VVSFLQVLPPKARVHLWPPYVPSTPVSSTWSLSFGFYHQNPVCASGLHTFHLHLCLPRGLFPSDFTTKILYAPLASIRSFYTFVFHVVSFPQVLPPKARVHLWPPYVPSTPLSSTWSLSLRFYHQKRVSTSGLHTFLLHLCLPRGVFPSSFTTKTLYAPLASMRSIYTFVFHVVSFPQVLPPKARVHLWPPYVPSTPLSSTWSLSLRFYHQKRVCNSGLHTFHLHLCLPRGLFPSGFTTKSA